MCGGNLHGTKLYETGSAIPIAMFGGGIIEVGQIFAVLKIAVSC